MADRKRSVPKSAPVGEEVPPLAGPAAASATFRKRQEEKHRKKDPRSWENVLKHIATIDEADKLTHVSDRYKELYEQFRGFQQENDRLGKDNAKLTKEHSLSQAEYRRCVLQRSNIEGACRALQQQNKELKEKYIGKCKEDEEHRKKTAEGFEEAMNSISKKVEEHRKVNESLNDDNINMKKKLGELIDRFKAKEHELETRNNQLGLERQRAEAMQQKSELELRAQQEIHSREMTVTKHNLQKSEANCNVLLDTVRRLQEHLDVYRNQYEGFEHTMTESTQVIDNYKRELENLTKQLGNLKQEGDSWKSKYYDTMKALIEMTEMKGKQELYLQSLDKKNEQLQKLCRQLQKDRSSYLKLLKENGIEATASSANDTPEDEEGKKIAVPKMTNKEKELQLLKENLKAVQQELTRLSVDEADKTQRQTDPAATLPSENVDTGHTAQNIETPIVPEANTEAVPSQIVEELKPVLEPIASKVVIIDDDKSKLISCETNTNTEEK